MASLNPHVPLSAEAADQAFAGKEALEALPFGIHLHAHARADVGGTLQENFLGAVKVAVLEVAGAAGGNANLAGAALRGESDNPLHTPARAPTSSA